jgi:hypothetical protein
MERENENLARGYGTDGAGGDIHVHLLLLLLLRVGNAHHCVDEL